MAMLRCYQHSRVPCVLPHEIPQGHSLAFLGGHFYVQFLPLLGFSSVHQHIWLGILSQQMVSWH